jgi:DNA helicase HerA-like ATPase
MEVLNMAGTPNPIEALLDREVARPRTSAPSGPIATMLDTYDVGTSSRLLGFLLELGYDEMRLVTCDAWKRNCGGVPRNSFVIVKLNEAAAGVLPGSLRRFLVLARISETATTPVASDIQATIFQIHKVQAKIDPLTNAELQWGALKASILGTYYDGDDATIQFGNDVDSFMSPHFYEIYVPTEEHLETLINTFVADAGPIKIGRLRYTETETISSRREVEVRVSPSDFLSNRTALFGKTRMGKSNTIKVILDTLLRSQFNIGQVVFDLSGEYTYPDPQTGASLYLCHRSRCTRYSLRPRHPQAEQQAGAPAPKVLRTNFYEQVVLGHAIIHSLFDSVHQRRPDYMAPFFGWEPLDEAEIPERYPDEGDRKRCERILSMYLALLYEAGFPYKPPPQPGRPAKPDRIIPLRLNAAIRQEFGKDPAVQRFAQMEQDPKGTLQIADKQRLDVAPRIYERLWTLYSSDRENAKLFPVSTRNGKPYFEPIHQSLLKMIGDTNISGAKKLTPFNMYHDPAGSDVAKEIVDDVEAGKTVLVDLANADAVVRGYYSEMLSRAVLARQMTKFSELEAAEFDKHSVLFYFEEAHNLFRADDKDLTSVYNKLAKEGAKFRIGMVYATQSMTTLSPDLLKNTENFFIAHLNDDREIREIERRYEFNGIGLDVQRARSKGYVRMITLSHRYALPVQIRLFQPGSTQLGVAAADGRSGQLP